MAIGSTIQTFLRSRLYAHFWLFALKSAVAVGLVSSAPFVFFYDPSNSESLLLFAAVFFIGAMYGFVAAIVGFWLIFFLMRLKLPVSFSVLAPTVGGVLGLGVLGHFYYGGESISKFVLLNGVLFPLAPLVLSVFAFAKLCSTHLKPFIERSELT